LQVLKEGDDPSLSLSTVEPWRVSLRSPTYMHHGLHALTDLLKHLTVRTMACLPGTISLKPKGVFTRTVVWRDQYQQVSLSWRFEVSGMRATK